MNDERTSVHFVTTLLLMRREGKNLRSQYSCNAICSSHIQDSVLTYPSSLSFLLNSRKKQTDWQRNLFSDETFEHGATNGIRRTRQIAALVQ